MRLHMSKYYISNDLLLKNKKLIPYFRYCKKKNKHITQIYVLRLIQASVKFITIQILKQKNAT